MDEEQFYKDAEAMSGDLMQVVRNHMRRNFDRQERGGAVGSTVSSVMALGDTLAWAISCEADQEKRDMLVEVVKMSFPQVLASALAVARERDQRDRLQ